VLGNGGQLQQVNPEPGQERCRRHGARVGSRRLLRVKSAIHDPTACWCRSKDSGAGIDPKDIERIFESFYTTKSPSMEWSCDTAGRSSKPIKAVFGRHPTSVMGAVLNVCCRRSGPELNRRVPSHADPATRALETKRAPAGRPYRRRLNCRETLVSRRAPFQCRLLRLARRRRDRPFQLLQNRSSPCRSCR